jgi:hypothetical protein
MSLGLALGHDSLSKTGFSLDLPIVSMVSRSWVYRRPAETIAASVSHISSRRSDPMAKFYVQCGQTDLVLSSDSPESAALAMTDRLLTPHLWIYDDPKLSELDCRQHLMLEALMHLPTEIRISEQGFNRTDFDSVSVPETIHTWHALMVGIRRLFVQAGLDRRVAVLTGSRVIDFAITAPRLPR